MLREWLSYLEHPWRQVCVDAEGAVRLPLEGEPFAPAVEGALDFHLPPGVAPHDLQLDQVALGRHHGELDLPDHRQPRQLPVQGTHVALG